MMLSSMLNQVLNQNTTNKNWKPTKYQLPSSVEAAPFFLGSGIAVLLPGLVRNGICSLLQTECTGGSALSFRYD
jgi:hypothetical protein